MNTKWSAAEDNFLREKYGVLSKAEIAQHLGRTPEAVKLRIYKFRLSKRNWSEEDIEYLKESWGNKSVPTIAAHLHRSEEAIKLKVSKLKLGNFLQNGDRYVTKHFLCQALGYGGGTSGYMTISFIENRGLPTHKQKVSTQTFDVVYIDEFWKWAEKNKSFLNFSKFEKYTLGPEPKWVAAKRSHDVKMSERYKKTPWTTVEDSRLKKYLEQNRYSLRQLSDMLQRTEGAIQRRINDLGFKNLHPVKADNHTKWTDDDWKTLTMMIKHGDSYEAMSDALGRSAKAIRGRVFEMYLTENLDKVRAYIGRGKWGHGKPDRPLRYRKQMSKGERKNANELLSALAGDLLALAKTKSGVEDQFKDFWQKDLCMCWDEIHGCTAGEKDCDSCSSFRRIPVQFCKRCGKDFFERKSNDFCNDCRKARLKKAQRKYAILNSKKRYSNIIKGV